MDYTIDNTMDRSALLESALSRADELQQNLQEIRELINNLKKQQRQEVVEEVKENVKQGLLNFKKQTKQNVSSLACKTAVISRELYEKAKTKFTDIKNTILDGAKVVKEAAETKFNEIREAYEDYQEEHYVEKQLKLINRQEKKQKINATICKTALVPKMLFTKVRQNFAKAKENYVEKKISSLQEESIRLKIIQAKNAKTLQEQYERYQSYLLNKETKVELEPEQTEEEYMEMMEEMSGRGR